MKCKKASLVINPRSGQNVARLADVIAVLSAAGWDPDIGIKEYGGHSMALATRAAKTDADLVIAYGGDGTLNQVVNGVMNTKGQHSVVATIPGGTVNEWAGDIGVPFDPVRAALTLVNSDVRKVDIGHVEVQGLTFPETTQMDQQQTKGKKAGKKAKASSKARHHFLLMAGLGIDAAVMAGVNKSLKYKIGRAAVALSIAEEWPKHRAFPVEVRATGKGSGDADMVWKGEAQQVIIGNTRRYAGYVEMTPDAYIDDGVLDVCVITEGNPFTTMQQIASLFLRHKPDDVTAEFFHGAHLSITVPASVAFHLDGTAVRLKDYLGKSERNVLQHTGDMEHVMVNYRFDAMPHALQAAIPHTYNDTLFEKSAHKEESQEVLRQPTDEEKSGQQAEEDIPKQDDKWFEKLQHDHPDLIKALLESGRKVTVIGVSQLPDKKNTYVVAGTIEKQSTGEIRPVAVRIDSDTTIINSTGGYSSPAAVQNLQEGTGIVVEGKKSKRGVISATRVVI